MNKSDIIIPNEREVYQGYNGQYVCRRCGGDWYVCDCPRVPTQAFSTEEELRLAVRATWGEDSRYAQMFNEYAAKVHRLDEIIEKLETRVNGEPKIRDDFFFLRNLLQTAKGDL